MKTENPGARPAGLPLPFIEGFEGEVIEKVMLRDHTSLRIGGRADFLFRPSDLLSLKGLVRELAGAGLGYVMIGGGTNVLVTDSGIDGAVINLRAFRRLEVIEERGDDVVVSAGAGLPLQRLMALCREEGLGGLEGLVGVPGTVGGAVFGNAGAFGYEIMDRVQGLTLLMKGDLTVLGREDLQAAYRCGGIGGDTVILGADLLLERDDREALRKRMAEFLRMKKQSQPLGEPSAGCVFKNPPGCPAGKLIDEARCKGLRKGDIEVSGVHANFFINRGEGSSADFLALMEMVAGRVLKAFGIVLEPEIRILGRNSPEGQGGP